MDSSASLASTLIMFFLIVLIGFGGLLTSYIAKEKGYAPIPWFVIGFFFNIIGLIAAGGLPDKHARPTK